jgi:hypothetical protein
LLSEGADSVLTALSDGIDIQKYDIRGLLLDQGHQFIPALKHAEVIVGSQISLGLGTH